MLEKEGENIGKEITSKVGGTDEATPDEPKYTLADYMGSAPYAELYALRKGDPFDWQIASNRMAAEAASVGFKSFVGTYKKYEKSQELRKRQSTVYIDNVTTFDGQSMELNAGSWQADELGVYRYGDLGSKEIACAHPIMPVERLVNVDTGEEKMRLAYRKGRQWRNLIVDKATLASSRKITDLASNGISVTSQTAAALVEYINDMENLNYDLIPENKCITRLGYIDGEGFSPYFDGLVFDGNVGYKSIFNAIRKGGKRGESLELLREVRAMSTVAKIVIAASFGSVLVAPLGALPFFVHLWGVDSGTGKTVALMAAASVWADPRVGEYIKTFNSTDVGYEKMAAFLNHLPLMLDELMLTKKKQNFDVYLLAQGVGRTRGNKQGGVDRTDTWGNCIITTGENPLTGLSDGAGAVNRVLDIECKADNVVVRDGQRIAGEARKHFGYAGREFVARLYDGEGENIELAKATYQKAFAELSANDTTEKQAMAAAVLVAADQLVSEWLLHDEPLTIKEISAFLASKAAVSRGNRGYQYMCDWVTVNSNRFQDDANDVFGKFDDIENTVYIVRSVFDKTATEAGYQTNALLSYLKSSGLIDCRGRATTKSKRINGRQTECVCMKLPNGESDENGLDDGFLPL